MIHQKLLFSASLLLLALLLLVRCANPVSPEGGKKDIIPPRIVVSDPPNQTLRFNEKQIKITFDEFVHLENQAQEIIIAPPTLPETEFRVQGKSVVVGISDPLLENTTYTINFGNSIQDLTENNILYNFTYVFSTGDYIDSLSLAGKVISAFDLSPQKEVYAMLYMNNNDTVPFDSLPFYVKPYYITKTNEQGEFSFTNLADQPLLLFALSDQNGNAIYDMPNEKIAFLDTLVRGYYDPPSDTLKKDTTAARDSIAVTDSIVTDTINKKKISPWPEYTIRMFEEADTVQKLLKKENVREGQFALYFRRPLRDLKVALLNTNDTIFFLEEYSPKRDTLFLWLTTEQKDTLNFVITEEGNVIDTVAFPVLKSRKSRTVPKLSVMSNMQDGTLNYFRTEPEFTFSAPLRSADFSGITLSDGKDTVKANISFSDTLHRKIRVRHNWKESTSYSLIIPDSVFYSYNNITNDSLRIDFRTRGLKDLGSLTIDAVTADESAAYIFQLMNDKEKVIEEHPVKKPGKIKFDFLSPGSYKIKVILDRNMNGKWDPGIFSRRLQPETVKYYPETVEVRSNWDVEEKWEF